MEQLPVGGVDRAALIARAKNLLLKPADEWSKIDDEPATIADLFKGWVLPLAAIPALATLIGSLLFGHSLLGITYRPSITEALSTAVVQYVLTLASIFVIALVIDFLAPQFSATANRVQAFKVAAYSATAGWVAGIFNLLPALGILALIGGLYSLYLLYLGLPRLMKAPAEKALPYTAVVVLAAVLAFIAMGAVVAPVAAMFGGAPTLASNDGEVSGTLSVPGVGSVDLGKLEAASKQIEAASQQMQAGANGEAVAALDPNVLQGMLPATIGGFTRSELSSASASAAGLGGSSAEARYGTGDATMTLKVTDLAAAGGLAALGTAFNVQSSRQTETGYEKTGTVDGRMTSEKWDNNTRSGSFGVLVANRFMVEAEGSNVGGIDALKSAVASVDLAKLESAAR
ncbi:Yip1 family protein [Sphingomonas cavernae]|uniref:YIP1 family protein n=1 Tax=Sphingomonas cavernae TaxID=2320861 RepID=A0A418WKN1_9SPHN|nr:Yip1 family protein [Sphingomonas cavernae]RJF90502.1 YIP1 family protein [Sphingomonas cavernae]